MWYVKSPRPHLQPQKQKMTVESIMATLSRHIPVFHNVTSVSLTSSAKRSIASLLSPRAQYCVGEQLSVQVDMRNHMGELKSYGGDFILARIHSPNVMAAASGSVEDLRNGSYHVNFTLFWPGTVEASLLLVHPSEAVFSLWRARQQGYDKISYTGTFVNGSRQEKSLCNFRLSSNKTLCKYTDERGEEYYTCLKPPSLACESLTNFTSSYTQGSFFSDIENQLLKRDNIGVLIQNDFQAIEVLECDGATHNRSRLCEPGHISPLPSGYFLAKKWFSSSCHTGSFLSADSISRCLQGKTLYLRGDSTVRQWIEHLERTLKDMKYTDKAVNNAPMLAVDSQRNISVDWKKHAQPWITYMTQNLSHGPYISHELDRIGGGQNVAVVIGIGQHLRAFPLELFINRLLSIRRAIQRLVARSPQTTVFIKLENTRELTSVMVCFSDWHGHLQNLAQREVFGDLRVGIVDAWDMAVAANTFVIHPSSAIIAHQVDVLLSHLCPAQ